MITQDQTLNAALNFQNDVLRCRVEELEATLAKCKALAWSWNGVVFTKGRRTWIKATVLQDCGHALKAIVGE